MGLHELEEESIEELKKAHASVEFLLTVELKKLEHKFDSLVFEGKDIKGRLEIIRNAIQKSLNNLLDEEEYTEHFKAITENIKKELKKS